MVPQKIGQSSFTVVMANLFYNVFDIDLDRIPSDLDLKLLLHIMSRLVVVIKDLDWFATEKIVRIIGGSDLFLHLKNSFYEIFNQLTKGV